MENFKEKLIKLRTDKKISQQELSRLSSYTQTYISLIETGKVKASKRCQETLLKILENNE
ncbi:MAG: helix-turn-helix transcriptional regulator [Candidatus Paceibacterota bacterium]|jgi:transcriptional regulator with XRE-family HTH domain